MIQKINKQKQDAQDEIDSAIKIRDEIEENLNRADSQDSLLEYENITDDIMFPTEVDTKGIKFSHIKEKKKQNGETDIIVTTKNIGQGIQSLK